MKDLNKIIIIIPALNPNNKLIELVDDLKKQQLSNIIIVDDGSKEECQEIFLKLKEDKIKVYKHEKNLGKGQAIKTGISKVVDDDIIGIITVDADGQHLAKDVRRIAEKLEFEKVILGERCFKKNKEVPFASKIGNLFSSIYFKLITGIYLEDTQTGLRGIPKKYLNCALEVKGARYEYEMNFLKEMYYQKIDFETIEIETIYEGRIKNFNIVKDSYRIYKEVFKNIIASLSSTIIDVVLFYILISHNIAAFNASVTARIISGFWDFILNKKWVFSKSKNNNAILEVSQYLVLFVVQMLISSAIIDILNKYYFQHIIILKIFVNTIMYIANFVIKKNYIFMDKD